MRNFFLSTLFCTAFFSIVSGQGIEFFHGSWDEALMKAKAEDKIIFVDAFTTWCGPCKQMAANTFPNPEVGELFNQYFISLKIDMEKEMGLEFKKTFPVSAYPTLYFIDGDNKVVNKAVGAKSPVDLITLAKSIIGTYDRSTKFAGAYNNGDRSYDLVYNYVAALNKAGKSSVKIANDYLAEQKDLTTPENLKFILEAASQVDCQCFDLFEKYKSQIEKVVSKEAIQEKVRAACSNTVKRAIEFESADLVILAGEAMKRHIPSEADFFKSKSEIQYALAINDFSRIEDQVNLHAKRFIKDDNEAMHQLALDLSKYAPDNKTCIDLAISLASKAAKQHDPKMVATYAQLVYKSGQKAEAIQILDDAIKRYDADETNKDLLNLKALKNRIENS